MKKLFLCVVLLFCAAIPCHADILTLNDGDELFGKTISASASAGVGTIVFESDGKTQAFAASQVLKLEPESLRMIPGEETVEAIRDASVREALASPSSVTQYPEASRLDLLDEDRYDLDDKGGWVHTSRQLFTVLKEKAREDANHAFSYFPDLETQEIVYGRAITPPQSGLLGLIGGNPGAVRYLSDHTIADEADFTMVPQYQRQHTVKFAIPDVNLGTLVDRCVRVTRHRADPVEPFCVEKLFRAWEPMKRVRLVVSVPFGRNLTWAIDERGTKIIHRSEEEGGRRIHSFEASGTSPLLEEPQMPPAEREAPRVICAVPDSWRSIASRYAAVLAPIEKQAGQAPEVKDAVKRALSSLPASGTPDPILQIRAIFSFVAREIADAGVEPSAFSWTPLDPVKVLKSRQAGALDQAFLYHVLLRQIGIKHNLVLLRTRDDGRLAEGVPALGQMSRLAVEIPGMKGIAPINFPEGPTHLPEVLHSELYGAEGIRLSDGTRVMVPLPDLSEEGVQTHTIGTIREDCSLAVVQTSVMFGAESTSFRQERFKSDEELRKDLEQQLFHAFPGAKLIRYAMSDLADPLQVASLTVEFEVPGFALKSGTDLMVVPVPVGKQEYSAFNVGATKRLNDLFWYNPEREMHSIQLKLPPGYTLYALPEGTGVAIDGISYFSRLGFDRDRVTFTDVLERRLLELPAARYSEYKKLVEERSRTANQWIVIRKL